MGGHVQGCAREPTVFIVASLLMLLVWWSDPARGQELSTAIAPDAKESAAPADTDLDILDMDIEQLSKTDIVVPSMDVEVTSVSKQESTVGRSPAAIFVITNEMIRLSGVTSIPEALRMVPGLQVARIESSAWAISSRGFNDRYSNKLLVLIDGRTVYTPSFSRSLLGHSGRASGGHRADRGDPWSRRDAVGGERRQRGD